MVTAIREKGSINKPDTDNDKLHPTLQLLKKRC